MFINIIHFPAIKQGKDEEFRQWFAQANEEYARHKGFISRRLLMPREGGNYAAFVEHESYETFMAMHTSSTQAALNQSVKPLLDGSPTPQFFEVIELQA